MTLFHFKARPSQTEILIVCSVLLGFFTPSPSRCSLAFTMPCSQFVRPPQRRQRPRPAQLGLGRVSTDSGVAVSRAPPTAPSTRSGRLRRSITSSLASVRMTWSVCSHSAPGRQSRSYLPCLVSKELLLRGFFFFF